MALSKDALQDESLRDRLLMTIHDKPHRHQPGYHNVLDAMVKHVMNFASPEVFNPTVMHDFVSAGGKPHSLPQWVKAVRDAKKSVDAPPELLDAVEQDLLENVHPTSSFGGSLWSKPRLVPTGDIPIHKAKNNIDDCLLAWKGHGTVNDAMPLQFVAHRLLNLEKYEQADPIQRDAMDREWFNQYAHHLDGTDMMTGRKHHIQLSSLKRAVMENPNLIDDMLREQRECHETLQQVHGHAIHTLPSGEQCIHAARGLHDPEHNPDLTLASYASTPHTGFGTYQHKYLIPLNHVWYSYDIGKQSRCSANPENELIVDNQHPRLSPLNVDFDRSAPREFHSNESEPYHLWNRQKIASLLRNHIQQKHAGLNEMTSAPDWLGKVSPHVLTMAFASVPQVTYAKPDIRQKLAEAFAGTPGSLPLLGPIGMAAAYEHHGWRPDIGQALAGENAQHVLPWLVRKHGTLGEEDQKKILHAATKGFKNFNDHETLNAFRSRMDISPSIASFIDAQRLPKTSDKSPWAEESGAK
jgi:hypothetical protein